MLRFVAESISKLSSSTTSLTAGTPLFPVPPVAVNRTVSEAGGLPSTLLVLFKPGFIALLPPVFRRRALSLTIFPPRLSILSNAGLGAGGPWPPPPPLPVNPVTAEMILRGSLTSRTLRTPRLVGAGVEIELAGAVQTLGGVLGWCGERGTVDTSSPVVSVTDSLQEIAGGAVVALSAGPVSLGTLETAPGVGIEDVAGQTAVQALGGVWRGRGASLASLTGAAVLRVADSLQLVAGQTLPGTGGAGPLSGGTSHTGDSVLGVALTNQLSARFALSQVLSRSRAGPALDTAGEVRRYPVILQGSAPVCQEAVAGREPGENTNNIYRSPVTSQDPLLSHHLAGCEAEDIQQRLRLQTYGGGLLKPPG